MGDRKKMEDKQMRATGQGSIRKQSRESLQSEEPAATSVLSVIAAGLRPSKKRSARHREASLQSKAMVVGVTSSSSQAHDSLHEDANHEASQICHGVQEEDDVDEEAVLQRPSNYIENAPNGCHPLYATPAYKTRVPQQER